MSGGRRLDVTLVERGHFESRMAAKRAILAGEVRVDGRVADKPATPVGEDARIEVAERPRYVGQGGLKLEAALDRFQVEVSGKVCLDVGASTGGFTDCLLQRGATRVYAVDVGKGQLDWSLRNDPRVVVLEGVNARYLKPEEIGEAVDLATVDVAFISLKLVVPSLARIVKPEGELIPLVKPQFEAGRERVRPGGVVMDPQVHREVLHSLARFFERELDLSVVDAVPSPLTGPAGNIEFFLYIFNGPGRSGQVDWDKLIGAAHRAVSTGREPS